MAKLDMGQLRRISAEVEFLNNKALRIGWITKPLASRVNSGAPDDKMRDDKGITTPKTVAEVARAHELGRGVPERSMLKQTFVRKRDEIAKLQTRAVRAVTNGKLDSETAMAVVGEGILTEIKKRMVKGIAPPLSERRKKQKVRAGRSKDTPLINWGVLLNSPRYKIVPKA